MSDAYLSLAKSVLRAHGRPMSAKEIIEASKKYKMIPDHLHGKTMHKTLQARLSEDILANRFKSLFYRVSSGVFFLREFLNDDSISEELKREFPAARRQKPIRKQRVLCIESRRLPAFQGFSGNYEKLIPLLESNKSLYMSKSKADQSKSITQIMTFTVISNNGEILLHRVGKFSEYYGFSEGYTIGMRNNVGEFDVDLMNEDRIGVKRNASREIFRNIYFTRQDITDVEIMSRTQVIGLVSDDRKMLAFVLLFNGSGLEMDIRTKKKLGFNKANWRDPWNIHMADVDKWSQAVANAISYKAA